MKVTTLSVETIDQFLTWLDVRGRSPKTAKAYGTDLRTFLLDTTETSISLEEEFEDFGITWLQMNRERLSAKTTLRRRTSLSAFAKWAGMPASTFEDWIGPKPAKSIPHPLPEGIDAIRRMIAATENEKHRALVALCGYVGLRVSEALAVRPSHINTEAMALTVEEGKGGVWRIVPVTEACWDVLAIPMTRALLDGGRPIVGIDERFARRKIKDLGKRAKLQREVASHDLRATLATHVWNQTKDMLIVQNILGHTTMKTTQIYLGVQFEAIREGMQP